MLMMAIPDTWKCGNYGSSLVHNMLLMYSPNGINVNGQRGMEFEGMGSVYGVESCKVVFLRRYFLFTCSDTFAVGCISFSHSCTASQTGGQTDRHTDDIMTTVADHTMRSTIG